MRFSNISFALWGITRAFIETAASEGRYLRTKWRYPNTTFATGVNADDKCAFEEGVIVHRHTELSRASIGAYSYVGRDSILWNCTIGRFCSIGPEVRIGLGIHPVRGMISTYPGFYSDRPSVPIKFRSDNSVIEHRLVAVGNDVWIGARAMLIDGVKVGDGAVIAAGSIVTRDVPPYCVVAGIPAKVVRRRFTEEQALRLVAFAWWNRGIEFCSQHASLFVAPDQFFEMMDSQSGGLKPSSERGPLEANADRNA